MKKKIPQAATYAPRKTNFPGMAFKLNCKADNPSTSKKLTRETQEFSANSLQINAGRLLSGSLEIA
jgi:hypothetical protein